MPENQNPETVDQVSHRGTPGAEQAGASTGHTSPESEVTTELSPEPEGASDLHPEPETFPAEYVRQLRKEAADNRAKAKRADDYARELFVARVGALGKLHDAADMPFDAELLDDPKKLASAVDELVQRKPYMARQTVSGSVGQGATPTAPSVSLVDMLRG